MQGINHERREHLGLDLLNALARLACNHRLADRCQWAMAKMHERNNVPVLVHLDLGHHHVRWVDRDRHGRAVRLLLLEALKMHDPLLRDHCTTRPSAPRDAPRATTTSSSLRIGRVRIYWVSTCHFQSLGDDMPARVHTTCT